MIVLVGLYVFSINLLYGRYNNLKTAIDESTNEENILNEKLSNLQNVSTTISGFATTSEIALPEKNASVTALTQLKKAATGANVIITDIKIGPEVVVADSLPHSEIALEVEGNLTSILNFLKSSSKLLPLVSVSEVEINVSQASSRGSVKILSYWSPLPKELPALTAPLSSLGVDEQNLIKNLSSFSKPEFINLQPATPVARNPFTI